MTHPLFPNANTNGVHKNLCTHGDPPYRVFVPVVFISVVSEKVYKSKLKLSSSGGERRAHILDMETRRSVDRNHLKLFISSFLAFYFNLGCEAVGKGNVS